MSDDFSFEDVVYETSDVNQESNNQGKGVEGEKRLIVAVLRTAVDDALSEDPEIRLEAEEWIFESAGTNERETYTFEFICQELNLNPSCLRDAISKFQLNNN